MKQTLTFKQITLITDGYSNQGVSPIVAAREAYIEGITVNVIGITDNRAFTNQGSSEIEGIAKAGGGLSQIVPIEEAAKTVQMVTRKAVNKTIQQVVHSQLTQILGKEDLLELPPSERIKVVQMMDQLAEHSVLKVLLLVDQSASMFKKMKRVEEALNDFQLSLLSRSGNSEISILSFPGGSGNTDVRIPWTNEIKRISDLLRSMSPKGNTPTGPAILESISYFADLQLKTGVLDEYIV